MTGGRRAHGEVMVASLATIYKKLKFVTNENIGWGRIHLPEIELQTTALADRRSRCRRRAWPATWRRDELDIALVGAGRAIQAVASVLLMVDPRDLGLVTQVRSPAPRSADHLPLRSRARWGRAQRAAVRPDRRVDRRGGRSDRRLRLRRRAARPARARVSNPTSTRRPSRCAYWRGSARDRPSRSDRRPRARRDRRRPARSPTGRPPPGARCRRPGGTVGRAGPRIVRSPRPCVEVGRGPGRARATDRGARPAAGRGRRRRMDPRRGRRLRPRRAAVGRAPGRPGAAGRPARQRASRTSRSSVSTPRRPVWPPGPAPSRSWSESGRGSGIGSSRSSCSCPTTPRSRLS